MTSFKDLPPGSQPWARNLDDGLAKLREIEAMARRICADYGLDYSNPARGLGEGPMPSVTNPVQLKLPSLKDLDIRDAQDGDLLTFDGKRGVWVARRHSMVQIPKPPIVGDPDSYYEEPGPAVTPADTWSVPEVYKNFFLDPGCELRPELWSISEDQSNTNTHVSTSLSTSTRYEGNSALQLSFTNTSAFFVTQSASAEYRGLPLTTRTVSAWVLNTGTNAPRIYLTFTYPTGSHSSYVSPRVTVPVGQWQRVSATGSPSRPQDGTPIECSALISTNATRGTATVVYVDQLHAGTTAHPEFINFHGDTPDGNGYAYSWDGDPNNSTSTAAQTRRIQVPGTITLGTPFEVNGEGYSPGEVIEVYEWIKKSATSTVTADAQGKFSTILTIPANTDPTMGPVASTNGVIGAKAPTGYAVVVTNLIYKD